MAAHHDIRERHVLADESVVYIHVIGETYLTVLVSPILGEEPVNAYEGPCIHQAMEELANILASDVTEGELYA